MCNGTCIPMPRYNNSNSNDISSYVPHAIGLFVRTEYRIQSSTHCTPTCYSCISSTEKHSGKLYMQIIQRGTIQTTTPNKQWYYHCKTTVSWLDSVACVGTWPRGDTTAQKSNGDDFGEGKDLSLQSIQWRADCIRGRYTLSIGWRCLIKRPVSGKRSLFQCGLYGLYFARDQAVSW